MYQINTINGFAPTVSTIEELSPQDELYVCKSNIHEATIPIHGVKKILITRGSTRVIWSVLMLIALGTAAYFTLIMFDEYNDYQTTTHLSILQNNSLLMPSIHICPKNPDHLIYNNLYRDIEQRVGNISLKQKNNLMKYVIAGFGFQNSGMDGLSSRDISPLNALFNKWKGERSLKQMFEFVFEQNGLTCKDLLKNCSIRGREFDCCKAFKPHYITLRGKCMRLEPIAQKGASETDRLRLDLELPQSRLVDGDVQKQFVIYMGDQYPEIYFVPRFYYTVGSLGQIAMRARLVRMLHRETCGFVSSQRGRSTCFLNNWIRENLVEPFNCSFAYLRTIPDTHGVPICHPQTVVGNYNQILEATNVKYKCNLNCDRWDFTYTYSEKSSRLTYRNQTIDMYFSDIMYEVYTEVAMTSFTGFVSQIGGQTVLFLGTSIISIAYICEIVFMQIFNKIGNR